MSRAQRSITVIGLAVVFTGCGGSGQTTQPQEGSAGGSTANPGGSGGKAAGGATVSPGGSNATGGTTVNPGGGSGNGGQGGNSTGGTTANPAGGSGGNATGGATLNPGGGNATGGTTVNPTGGSGGNATGGSGGKATGGATVNPAGGNATGGATVNPTGGSGGKASGGSASGGSPTGGVQSTGGSSGTAVSTNTLITSASGAYWKTGTWTEVTSTATVTINDSSTSQTWDGFGGSFNEKGWSYLTTQAMKDQAIQALFGKDGCNFAWGRIPIGASDYALSRYTDDEVASGSTDYNMASFSITRDQQTLIPYIKAAQAVKSDIRFWASPWTPPTWMKTGPYSPDTGKSTTSNFDGGT